eukprot:403365067
MTDSSRSSGNDKDESKDIILQLKKGKTNHMGSSQAQTSPARVSVITKQLTRTQLQTLVNSRTISPKKTTMNLESQKTQNPNNISPQQASQSPNIHKKRKVSLRRQITLVKQNTMLFGGGDSTKNQSIVEFNMNGAVSPSFKNKGSLQLNLKPQLSPNNKNSQNIKVGKHQSVVVSPLLTQPQSLMVLQRQKSKFRNSSPYPNQQNQKSTPVNSEMFSGGGDDLNEESEEFEVLMEEQDDFDPLQELVDCFEIKFYQKGEYLFKKGQKADYAYVVLYGQVIFLDVKSTTYLKGLEPQTPSSQPVEQSRFSFIVASNFNQATKGKNKEITDFNEPRKTKIDQGETILVEEEIKIAETGVGFMIGEIAMMDPLKATRALSGMAKTDCVFLLLNNDSFDVLVKEKQKKLNEQMTQFIFDYIPRMKDLFQFKKVSKNVHVLFKLQKVLKNHDIIKEGGKSDKLYILKSGQCTMYKLIEMKDNLGISQIKREKIMNIEQGSMFGEGNLIFNSDNSYTITSVTPVTLLEISYKDIIREFKRIIPSLTDFFNKRNNFILEREQFLKTQRKHERKHFNSKIEKGDMDIFLQKDFKSKVSYADNQTKKRMQVFYLRKELDNQMKKEDQEQNQKLETRDKIISNIPKVQNISGFASYTWNSQKNNNNVKIEVFNENNDIANFQNSQLKSKDWQKTLISPQHLVKDIYGQINQNSEQKFTLKTQKDHIRHKSLNTQTNLNEDQFALGGQQSHRSSFTDKKQILMEMLKQNIKRNRNQSSNFSFYNKNFSSSGKQRSQSQASLMNYTKGVCNSRIFKSINLKRESDNELDDKQTAISNNIGSNQNILSLAKVYRSRQQQNANNMFLQHHSQSMSNLHNQQFTNRLLINQTLAGENSSMMSGSLMFKTHQQEDKHIQQDNDLQSDKVFFNKRSKKNILMNHLMNKNKANNKLLKSINQ